jgi:hypothetical protein
MLENESAETRGQGGPRNSLADNQCRIITMRNAIAAAGAVCTLASPALAVETSNFNLATTRDLVALCSDQPNDPLYAEALQFCYGYMAGVAQLHRALVRADDIKPVACPQHEVTREALVGVFLDWARANPGAMDELPAESVKRAANGAWPCGS